MTHSEGAIANKPDKTQSIIKIQSVFRGQKTRVDLESAGLLYSQKKSEPEPTQDLTGPPYVNNLDSEHAPADGTIIFVSEFPNPTDGKKFSPNPKSCP
jgi:hypothetical protein